MLSDHVSKLRFYGLAIGNPDQIARGRFSLEFTDLDETLVHGVEFEDYRPVVYHCDD